MGKLYLGTQEITPFVYDKVEDIGIPREISQSGVYQMPSSSFTYTLPAGVTDLGQRALYQAFNSCTGIEAADLRGLVSISSPSGLGYAFQSCTNLVSADISNLTTVSAANAAVQLFYNCTSLTHADLGSLTTVSGERAINYIFSGCISLTSVGDSLASVNLNNLTTISGNYGAQRCFNGCTGITTIIFNNLTTLTGEWALQHAFYNCTSLTTVSFPSLSTFGRTANNATYFENMLQGCSGVTVHFPAAIQSVISTWNDVVNKFGGTNITILYDL